MLGAGARCWAGGVMGLVAPGWMEDGKCVGEDVNLWFPVGRGGGLSSPADYTVPRAFCDRCPVKVECLEWALEHDARHGMWGGKTPQQRAREITRRAA